MRRHPSYTPLHPSSPPSLYLRLPSRFPLSPSPKRDTLPWPRPARSRSRRALHLHNKLTLSIATSVVGPLHSLAEVTGKSVKAVNGLTSNAATQLAGLNRWVEELSDQLVSVAQTNRQQQDLLEKIWEKVNCPPTPPPDPGEDVCRRGCRP